MTRSYCFLASLAALIVAWSPALAQTVIIDQEPISGGGVSRASQLWQDPGPNGNDLDGDAVCWADFTLTSSATIDHMEWWGNGACELGFRIQFWPQDPNTIAYQPLGVFYYGGDHSVHPTATFDTTAFTTSPGPGGLTHYSLDLANPVSLPPNDAGNVRWFVSVIGLTHQAYVTWNWSQATIPSNRTYQFIRGLGFRSLGDGRAMLLRASGAPSVTIAASADPAGSGVITGAGAYPIGSFVTLHAAPNSGWGFVNWTEGAAQVSTNPTYTFAASVNRTLVAHFISAYTITTAASPPGAGVTAGSGVYNSGESVTVTATPNRGYIFSDWAEYGATISTSPTYTLAADANHNFVANFYPDPAMVFFDFDNAPVHTSLPVDVVSAGLTAHLSATGQGFSIQPANTLGFTPQGFGGLCIYPNSVFAADLVVAFDQPVTDFSIMYSPQELGCDDSATMRATAYQGNVFVATATATAPAPGTWPTGTLMVASPQGFDRVVVHYDSRPPTCQDWGPIFLADNMIVTPAPFCVADFNHSGGTPDDADVAAFFYAWNLGDPSADINGSGGAPDDADVYSFFIHWTMGC